MILSDSLSSLLRAMPSDPIARALLRARDVKHEMKEWGHHDISPVSIGQVFSPRYPAQYFPLVKKCRRWLQANPPGDYFACREKKGLISYLPSGRVLRLTPDGKWARDGRQEMKPARWARAILSPRAIRHLGGDPALSEFARRFNSIESVKEYTVTPEPWDVAYSESTFPVPFGSCMWGKNVGEFYGKFPCEAMVLRHNGVPVARAILWHEFRPFASSGIPTPLTVEHRVVRPIKLLDRVYTYSSTHETAFHEWAKSEGIFFRKDSGTLVCPLGEYHPLKGLVQAHSGCYVTPKNIFCPYLDTFRYGAPDSDGEVSTLSTREGENSYSFDSQHGSFDGGPEEDDHEGEVQDVDGEWIDADDAIMIYDSYYSPNDERICYCERSQEYFLTSACYRVEISRGNFITIHSDYVESL